MLSPARCMTASKPETASGEIGCAGSQGIRSSSLVERWFAEPCETFVRVNRATCAPLDFSEGNSADPIGPDAPLTRIRDMRILTMVQHSSRPRPARRLRRRVHPRLRHLRNNIIQTTIRRYQRFPPPIPGQFAGDDPFMHI